MSDATALREALAAAGEAELALLALGIPLCPSCELLETSLAVVARTRPGLRVEVAALASPEEWADREELLWPRGIHVSRASLPVLVLLRRGEVVATRQGGGPASLVDQWLRDVLGPAERPLSDGLAGDEVAGLARVAALRSRHINARGVPTVD